MGMRVLSIIIGPALLCGCWKLETAAIPPNVLEFEPASGEGPEDWVVRTLPVPLECPDDQDTSFYIVYPRKEPETPMPAVVIYHSGSFDFVFAPSRLDEVSPQYVVHVEWGFVSVIPEVSFDGGGGFSQALDTLFLPLWSSDGVFLLHMTDVAFDGQVSMGGDVLSVNSVSVATPIVCPRISAFFTAPNSLWLTACIRFIA